ncbi:MAG: glycerol-3-phosphate acyltransferase [Clostridia bacterium]|nr:glycerol-3-phosphate acyltransferase [Clostridia bacterium]
MREILGLCDYYVLLVAVGAYLLGSINFAILITRRVSKQDIRDVGSGNAGMTNVLRSQGKIPALFTTLGDVGKSLIACFVGGWVLKTVYPILPTTPDLSDYTVEITGRYLAGLFCTLGHTFPVFFGFRGGKGVLVGFGMLIATDWRVALVALVLFVGLVAATRMVSLGSLCGAASAVLTTWLFGWLVDGEFRGILLLWVLLTAIVVSILFIMHRGNIQRLINGTERKLSFGSKKEE